MNVTVSLKCVHVSFLQEIYLTTGAILLVLYKEKHYIFLSYILSTTTKNKQHNHGAKITGIKRTIIYVDKFMN